eukprot:3698135-Alexandrium_andersonii.AAC.1
MPKPGVPLCLAGSGPALRACSLGQGSGGALDSRRPARKRGRGVARGSPKSICSLDAPDIAASRVFGNA